MNRGGGTQQGAFAFATHNRGGTDGKGDSNLGKMTRLGAAGRCAQCVGCFFQTSQSNGGIAAACCNKTLKQGGPLQNAGAQRKGGGAFRGRVKTSC